jgi:hypothetical protein
MMATLGGCGDGCELPSDRIKKSGDFLRWHQTDPLAHFAEVRRTAWALVQISDLSTS